MRLDAKTREIIKNEVADLIGADSLVRLFGSRVDDTQRGGDIDLLIETPQAITNRVLMESRLAARLYIRLGGQKVDVLIKDRDTPVKTVHRQALQHGVVL